MGGSEKGRQQGRGRIEGREGGGQDGREGASPPPTTEGGEDGGQRDQRVGARGMAAGWGVGNPTLRECAPRSGACDWPRVAMVAGAAFTGIHCSFCGGGGAGGRGGVLVVHIVHVCLCSAKCALEAVCRYQDFVDEGCARRSAQADLPMGEATNRMWPVHIWVALKTGKKQVCCAYDFSAGIKAEFRRKADATAARLRASQRACATTSPHLRMALMTGIQKNRCVGAPAHVPLFCRYQEFVEQQEDLVPQVENGRIMGSAWHQRQAKNRCVLLATFLQVSRFCGATPRP